MVAPTLARNEFAHQAMNSSHAYAHAPLTTAKTHIGSGKGYGLPAQHECGTNAVYQDNVWQEVEPPYGAIISERSFRSTIAADATLPGDPLVDLQRPPPELTPLRFPKTAPATVHGGPPAMPLCRTLGATMGEYARRGAFRRIAARRRGATSPTACSMWAWLGHWLAHGLRTGNALARAFGAHAMPPAPLHASRACRHHLPVADRFRSNVNYRSGTRGSRGSAM